MTTPTETTGLPAAYQPLPLPRPDASVWSTGLLDCGKDLPGCVSGFFFPWCMASHTFGTVETGVVEPNWCLGFTTAILDLTLCGGLVFIAHTAHIRCVVRSRFNIQPKETMCNLMAAVLCAPLANCQQHRELTARGLWPGGVFLTAPPTPLFASMRPPQPASMMGEPPVGTYEPSGAVLGVPVPATKVLAEDERGVHAEPSLRQPAVVATHGAADQGIAPAAKAV